MKYVILEIQTPFQLEKRFIARTFDVTVGEQKCFMSDSPIEKRMNGGVITFHF